MFCSQCYKLFLWSPAFLRFLPFLRRIWRVVHLCMCLKVFERFLQKYCYPSTYLIEIQKALLQFGTSKIPKWNIFILFHCSLDKLHFAFEQHFCTKLHLLGNWSDQSSGGVRSVYDRILNTGFRNFFMLLDSNSFFFLSSNQTEAEITRNSA